MKYLLIILFLFIAAIFFPMVRDSLLNSSNLSELKAEVVNIDHPKNTNEIRTHSRLGLLVGNGNHYDFFIGHVRAFNSTQAEIEKYYKKQTIKNPITRTDEDVELVFFEEGKNIDKRLPYEFENINNWEIETNQWNSVYALIVFRSYKANNDMRCH